MIVMDCLKILCEVNFEYVNLYWFVLICEELLLLCCVDDVVEMFECGGVVLFLIFGYGSNVILFWICYFCVMKFGCCFGVVMWLVEYVVYVDVGVSFCRVGLVCECFGLVGFEVLGNILGLVGGGIVMNVGVFGDDIFSVV